MKSLLASGCVAVALLSAGPSYAQVNVGSGLLGAGAGAALGAIAGGGRGAATGALVGGTLGAATGAFRPAPTYAHPYRGCRWVPAHVSPWGHWQPGHWHCPWW